MQVLVVVVVVVLAAVVVQCVCAARPVSRRRAAGRASIAEPLPREWSWRDVTARDAKVWSQLHRSALPPGKYASDPVNQHLHGWCGACWARGRAGAPRG